MAGAPRDGLRPLPLPRGLQASSAPDTETTEPYDRSGEIDEASLVETVERTWPPPPTGADAVPTAILPRVPIQPPGRTRAGSELPTEELPRPPARRPSSPPRARRGRGSPLLGLAVASIVGLAVLVVLVALVAVLS